MRPISNLTRVKVLLTDGMGYELDDPHTKKIFKIIKEFSILDINYYHRSSACGGSVTSWLCIKLTSRCLLLLSSGGTINFSITKRGEFGTSPMFRVAHKVKIDKVIKLIKEGITWNWETKKYWFKYLRNNKSLRDIKRFMVLKTFGGAKQ